MSKIKVKSLVPYTVGLNIPEYRISRLFESEGQVALIDAEALEDAMYSHGVRYLFEKGLLYLEDKEARIHFGFELPEEATEEEIEATPAVQPISTAEMIKLLKTSTVEEFEEKLSTLSQEQVNLMADLAIKYKVTDYNKSKILEKATGKNILKVVDILGDEE